MSQLLASGGQSTGVSASTSVLPMNDLSLCKDQLMCSPMCISSQVPASAPVTHFLMCWGPGTVLSPPRSCCDSVGSPFFMPSPVPPWSCFPLSEGGVCYQSFLTVCRVSLDKSADLLIGVLFCDRIYPSFETFRISLCLCFWMVYSVHLGEGCFGLKFWGDLLAS